MQLRRSALTGGSAGLPVTPGSKTVDISTFTLSRAFSPKPTPLPTDAISITAGGQYQLKVSGIWQPLTSVSGTWGTATAARVARTSSVVLGAEVTSAITINGIEYVFVINPGGFPADGLLFYATADDGLVDSIGLSISRLSPPSSEIQLGAGTTYYVRNDGLDTNSGLSDELAWKTLNKVSNLFNFSPGDNILLRRGDTWVENLLVHNSGTDGNPITYGAYGTGAKPIITGRVRVRSGYTAGGHWSVVQDLEIKNSTDRGVEIGGFDNLIFRRLDITGSASHGFEFKEESGNPSSNVLIDDCNIYGGNSYGIWGPAGDGTIIRRTSVYNNGLVVAANNVSVSPSGAGRVLLENVEAYGAPNGNGFGASIVHADAQITYRRCYAHNNGAAGAIGHGTAAGLVRYEYSVFANNGSGVAIGDNTASNAPVGQVINCTITGNPGHGLALQSTGAQTVKNTVIWNNATTSGVNYSHKLSTLTSDYNLLDDTNPLIKFAEGGTGKTLAEWLAYGYDAHSVVGDPAFVDPGNQDYTLQAVSPCITTGIASTLTGATNLYDADDTQIYSGTTQLPDGPFLDGVDIGAYAYVVGGKYYLSLLGPDGAKYWPSAPELIAITGVDNAVYDANGVGKTFTTPALALTALATVEDNIKLFVGAKGAVLYETDQSTNLAKIQQAGY